MHVHWNPSKADTIGTKDFVRCYCSEVSLDKGLVVDHAPLTIAASYTVDDKKDRIDERSVN